MRFRPSFFFFLNFALAIRGLTNYKFFCSNSLKPAINFARNCIESEMALCSISSVQSLSWVRLCDPMDCSTPDFPVRHQLPELAQTHVHWVGDAIQSYHPLSFPSSLAFSLSQHRVFSNELVLRIRWPKYWSFSISPSNEYSGLISFRIEWLDLLAVQQTLKSILQHHSSKTSVLWHSAFFTVQLSHPYMTTGKTIALTRQTFVGKAMSLLFNILSRLVITFLPRSKHLLISWLQSPSSVILEPIWKGKMIGYWKRNPPGQ